MLLNQIYIRTFTFISVYGEIDGRREHMKKDASSSFLSPSLNSPPPSSALHSPPPPPPTSPSEDPSPPTTRLMIGQHTLSSSPGSLLIGQLAKPRISDYMLAETSTSKLRAKQQQSEQQQVFFIDAEPYSQVSKDSSAQYTRSFIYFFRSTFFVSGFALFYQIGSGSGT